MVARRRSRCGHVACRGEAQADKDGGYEPLQDFALDPLHRLGISRRLVIVAQKVQEAMHREMGDMMGKRLMLGIRATRYRPKAVGRPRPLPSGTTIHWYGIDAAPGWI